MSRIDVGGQSEYKDDIKAIDAEIRRLDEEIRILQNQRESLRARRSVLISGVEDLDVPLASAIKSCIDWIASERPGCGAFDPDVRDAVRKRTGASTQVIENELEQLERRGEIYEPRTDHWRVT